MKYRLRIRDYRKLKSLSQEELAEILGFSQNFISEIENTEHDIKLSLLLDISATLEVCPCQLIDFDCGLECRKPL
jgi:transcriptional regulator with XRE-family HTH domain